MNSNTILNLLLAAASNSDLQSAFINVLSGLGRSLKSRSGDTAHVERVAEDLINNAPVILGAVVKSTPAAAEVPEAVKKAEQALPAIAKS